MEDRYTTSIIEKWANDPNTINAPYREFYNSLSSTKSMLKGTGEYQIAKSKWKIVNWWRKITDTEELEEIMNYTWDVPKPRTEPFQTIMVPVGEYKELKEIKNKYQQLIDIHYGTTTE